MTSRRIWLMASVASLTFGVASCHKPGSPAENVTVVPPRRDTARVSPRRDTAVTVRSITGLRLEDTSLVTVTPAEVRTFKLKTPGQRDSLAALFRRERRQWNASRPQNYRYLLRVECFCPGPRGWLVMEVRGGELHAWDRGGKAVPLTDWNTLTIDGLFDVLERSIRRDNEVRVGFDPRRHYPAYFYSVTPPGPDTWSIFEARGLRPL